ncbi:MAG: amidohydrolase family protein [Gemmataceae bacterium]|nr:amidohydrolase family protein [Gemmataceae bacterium]
MTTKRLLSGLALAYLLALLLTSPSFSTADEPDKKTAPTPKNAKPDKSKVLALVGGDVYTVTREVIRGGTVLVQDGKILRVGQDLAIPQGAKVLDAKGKYVLPGFVALSMTGVGVRTLGAGPGGGGGGAGTRGRLADTLDPFDRSIKFCLGVGITTGCVEVSGGIGGRFGRDEEDTQVCPCCGLTVLPTEPITPGLPTAPTPRRGAVLKMSYGELDPMLVKEGPFYHLPGTGLAGAMNHFNWREQIRQARKYVEEQAEHEKAVQAGKPSRPPRRPVADELIQLVKKETALRTDASSVDQIRHMIKLAKELDYRLVLENVHEAWLLADELAESKAAVVLTPRSRRRPLPGREESSGSSIETSSHLEKAGVPFAISTQLTSVSLDGVYGGRDLTGLPLEAAFAVRGGCTEKTALEALTIVPARILGLENRIGSIETGKDADLLILDGPPLDYRTYVQTVLVGGKIAYERNQDRVYPTFERTGR